MGRGSERGDEHSSNTQIIDWNSACGGPVAAAMLRQMVTGT